jgi:hypothetical protein
MTTTFKELTIGARFRAQNTDKIIHSRGDRGISRATYGDKYGDKPLVIQKRDEFGGHILDATMYGGSSVYYRIEPDNVVETV